jgi:hypothetical protein
VTIHVDWRVEENQGSCLAGIDQAINIVHEAATMNAFEPWFSRILIGLLQTAQYACRNLQSGWKKSDVPLLAWASRNSLEVVIWTKFVTSKQQNAWRFSVDWLNDANDLLRLGKELDNSVGSGTAPSQAYRDVPLDPSAVAEAEKFITEMRRQLASPQERRLDLAKVAKEVGEDVQFAKLNPLLSKLIHSTAYSVLSFPSDAARSGQALLMLDSGFWNLTKTIGILDAFLKAKKLPSIIESAEVKTSEE